VLLSVPDGETVAAGLSMPHSPRWYNGQLWLLESGSGSFGSIDLSSGRYEPLVQLPGFTRGLDFYDRYAFIGLSQVRESAIFSGLAITEQAERSCGVWVADLVAGQIVGFVRFEDAMQEIFAVQVLTGCRYPDVVNDDIQLIADSFILPDSAADIAPVDFVETPATRTVSRR
jgi:uncharacterized protein (TIGR03032 family)